MPTLQTLPKNAPSPASPTQDTRQPLPFEDFKWGSGIESSALPHLNVDQFQWTQHDRFWREDLKLAREKLGITTLRYALPWHMIEPRRGEFNWDYADERIAECSKLGLELIMDVVHFGTPLWLKQAVGDPEFPEALEEFTERYVGRYTSAIKMWCPFNEPLVTALFSGDLGFWPPHQRRWRGYMPVLSRVVQGTTRAIRAIRRASPEATVILCDAAENFRSNDKQLEGEVARRNLRRYVVMDLLTGRVDRQHPLFPWLTNYGVSELDLEWFRTHPQMPDVLGLDYYPHSDWQLDIGDGGGVRQSRSENPAGFSVIARAYYRRYGLPLMMTETSIDGMPINREIWLDSTLDRIRTLREDGIPLMGLIWWPLLDQLDWDGALTHRIGKIHRVGLFTLNRQPGGVLQRVETSLVKQFRAAMEAGDERIGKLEKLMYPAQMEGEDEQIPLGEDIIPAALRQTNVGGADDGIVNLRKRSNGNGNGHAEAATLRMDAAAGVAGEPTAAAGLAEPKANGQHSQESQPTAKRSLGHYGIVVFSHLRWGFVWQRPQQFLSRFAKKHQILFVEEPLFDLKESGDPNIALHRVMPHVTVVTPHFPASWRTRGDFYDRLRGLVHQAMHDINEDGSFDCPLLWYYSPMDSNWSLGHFDNRGVVYDCMDELSQFTGAPPALIANEARLMEFADIVFTGGMELSMKKKQRHNNVHFFGCGVEFDHFAQAQDPNTIVPPDIDFMARPILGWFGVIDERLDYGLIAEIARERPHWSIAMVGPVVKVDPNLLPHARNLYWLGQREYAVLPNYCRAFSACIMPFAINAATEYINPTKALEYMATGRPVISTPVKDVVRQYSELVSVVPNAAEFIKAAEEALSGANQQRVSQGITRARNSSWEATVAQMEGLITAAIKEPDRRSARPVTPITPAEASIMYLSTPGS